MKNLSQFIPLETQSAKTNLRPASYGAGLSLTGFTKNIIFVFTGTSIINFLNLVYQIVVLNKLNSSDFAAFNTLLSVFMLVSIPLQIVLAKYCAELNGRLKEAQIKALFTHFLTRAFILAALTFVIFLLFSPLLMQGLRIELQFSGLIMAMLLASAWIAPVFGGQLQGMEFFGWLISATFVSAVTKLVLAFIFINIGMSYPGALSALLFSNIIFVFISLYPLRKFIAFELSKEHIGIKKEAQGFLLPVAVSSLSSIALVTMDIILVKRYFIPYLAGIYSYAQFIGKIFFFLPGAIAVVILPHSSSLAAREEDTLPLLKRSLFYASLFCLAAYICYNIFDGVILKIFKALNSEITPEVISLGRFFGVSMSFFAILFILINYFISRKDLRFVKYLVMSAILQCIAIIVFHKSLFHIQAILCINSILVLIIHLKLAFWPCLKR